MSSNTVRNSKYARLKTPSSIDSLIDGAFKAHRIKTKVKDYSIFQLWEKVVGPEMAEVAIPEKITRGHILVVNVADAVWAQEMTMRKDFILNQFRSLEFGPVIEDIRFVVSSPKEISSRKR